MRVADLLLVKCQQVRKRFARCARDTSGAVTVDWVVITAGVVGLAATIQVFINPVVVGEHGGAVNQGMMASVNSGLSGTMLSD